LSWQWCEVEISWIQWSNLMKVSVSWLYQIQHLISLQLSWFFGKHLIDMVYNHMHGFAFVLSPINYKHMDNVDWEEKREVPKKLVSHMENGRSTERGWKKYKPNRKYKDVWWCNGAISKFIVLSWFELMKERFINYLMLFSWRTYCHYNNN